jgi:DNA-binding HxlR family transcriptional regulator
MSHNEHCPVEATLELIGGKYKTLILWHLANGKLRFSQLRREITGITPKMLTQQLRELEAHCLVHREVFPIVPPKVEYSLTDIGKKFQPVVSALETWGEEYIDYMKAR